MPEHTKLPGELDQLKNFNTSMSELRDVNVPVRSVAVQDEKNGR